MRISDTIEQFIKEMLGEDSPEVELKRNELAEYFGCAPSQINYVLATRFSPSQGYLTESHRGGGGYILITRADSHEGALMSVINSIGDSIDERSARAHLYNLNYQKLIDDRSARIMLQAVLDSNFKGLDRESVNSVRAKQLKQMLVAYID